MPRKWRHVYVIYRIDERSIQPMQDNFDDRTTIKSVFDSEKFSADDMTKEIDRLNKLNAQKGARYYWQIAKWYEEI